MCAILYLYNTIPCDMFVIFYTSILNDYNNKRAPLTDRVIRKEVENREMTGWGLIS